MKIDYIMISQHEHNSTVIKLVLMLDNWQKKKAIARRRANRILGILDESDNWQDDNGKIFQIFVSYFQKIFTTAKPSLQHTRPVLDSIDREVTPEMNDKLLRPFTPPKIEQVVKSFHPTKTPGPDGFPKILGHCWSHHSGELFVYP